MKIEQLKELSEMCVLLDNNEIDKIERYILDIIFNKIIQYMYKSIDKYIKRKDYNDEYEYQDVISDLKNRIAMIESDYKPFIDNKDVFFGTYLDEIDIKSLPPYSDKVYLDLIDKYKLYNTSY